MLTALVFVTAVAVALAVGAIGGAALARRRHVCPVQIAEFTPGEPPPEAPEGEAWPTVQEPLIGRWNLPNSGVRME